MTHAFSFTLDSHFLNLIHTISFALGLQAHTRIRACLDVAAAAGETPQLGDWVAHNEAVRLGNMRFERVEDIGSCYIIMPKSGR